MSDTANKAQENFPVAFSTDIVVDKQNPWNGDVLGRGILVEQLTKLVQGAENSSFVISIHGGWGSGKTFMLQRWRQQLINSIKNNGYGGKAIYFNAWEDDFHADPLVAIIGQLCTELQENNWAKEIIKSLKESISEIVVKKVLGSQDKESRKNDWKKIIKSLTKYIPAIVTKKILSSQGLDKKDFQSSATQVIDEYLNNRKQINVLKGQLETLAATVKMETGMPLVFIVDELDRCRPSFAIELLERIKHVFGVPNIVFVLGINKTQLEKSIKPIYGDIDADDYFRKFFDINLNLPPTKSEIYCQHLLRKYKIIELIEKSRLHSSHVNGEWRLTIEKIYAPMIGVLNMSLREIEQACRILFFFLSTKNTPADILGNDRKVYKDESIMIICFVCLLVKNRDLYEEFVQNDCKSIKVIDYMLGEIERRDSIIDIEHYRNIIEGIFYGCATIDDGKEIREILSHYAHGNLSRPSSQYLNLITKRAKDKKIAEKILYFMDMTYDYTQHHVLGSSTPAIDIAKSLDWGMH